MLFLSGLLLSHAQEETPAPELAVEHADCSFFGARREAFVNREARAGKRSAGYGPRYSLSETTEQVAQTLAFIPGGSRSHAFEVSRRPGGIDSHLFADMQAAGVTPAAKSSDSEFLRRATLDLTGRIPTPERVQAFLADAAPDKRAKLIDELLASAEWADKWTMYFGDLYNNNVRNTQVTRFNEGRNAFYKWIKDSLTGNKPYNVMATELISTRGANSYQQGEVNWLVGGIVTGGPQQDIWDQQAANIGETFLGIGHMSCILCHNGRGHLDQLSLWGKRATRMQGWQLSSFLSHSNETRVNVTVGTAQQYYWSTVDDTPALSQDYRLNTTTGNRPARQPIGTQQRVAPVYPFSGRSPAAGENYRAALAREVTSDFQFARATVNYVWKEFFGRGIVDPANQFDPARLDPDNPPTDLQEDGTPWGLQPSNARLLNSLAQRFIEGGYNLKSLMRELANSEAYQLSSRYDGQWNPAWEKLFARKFVRRLWAEEIHDALVLSSGVTPTYNINGFSNLGFGPVSLAMQFPDVVGMPGGAFLDSFLRGNRDDENRRSDGSLLQALNQMNDTFVMTRIRATGTNANKLLRNMASLNDDQLVTSVYLGILSRYPTDTEKQAAIASLRTGARTQKAENLVWSLYNKVDFIFNY